VAQAGFCVTFALEKYMQPKKYALLLCVSKKLLIENSHPISKPSLNLVTLECSQHFG
jgi:hypothetical protein